MTIALTVLGVLGVPAVAVVAGYVGLRVVARFCGEDAKRDWQAAVEKCGEAAAALRGARSERKAARAKLAVAKHVLKRTRRELRAVGAPPPVVGEVGGASARAGVVRSAEDAFEEADGEANESMELVRRRRDEVATARREVRARARDACTDAYKFFQKTYKEEIDDRMKQWRMPLLSFVRDFFKYVTRKVLWDWARRYYKWGVGLFPIVAGLSELLYYRHFDFFVLQHVSSASLSTLVSAVLWLSVVAVFSLIVSFVVIIGCVSAVPTVLWLLAVLVGPLLWMFLRIFGVAPVMACRSTLCARLATPGGKGRTDGYQ